MSTRIEWCDETWSPIVGCSKRTAGCANCYAIRECHRMGCNPNPTMRANYGGLTTGDGKDWTGEVRLLMDRLDRPAMWKTPKLVFVNPLADLFHHRVRIAWVEEIFDAMRTYHQHTYIVLTKRWEWMKHICPSPPLPNLLLGVSVHNRASFDLAWPYLRETPAAGRVLSYEPALGALALPGDAVAGDRRLAWAICGGESGKRARPMHPDWARSVRDQCQAAQVPFFFKGWGEFAPAEKMINRLDPDYGKVGQRIVQVRPDDKSACAKYTRMNRVGKRAAGRELDGRTWDERPWVRRA